VEAADKSSISKLRHINIERVAGHRRQRKGEVQGRVPIRRSKSGHRILGFREHLDPAVPGKTAQGKGAVRLHLEVVPRG
jgi:hypothetical protein